MMAQLLEFPPLRNFCSRLPQFITAIPGEEPRELILAEVISARVLAIGLEQLRQFRLRFP